MPIELNPLFELGHRAGTDKCNSHSYAPFYHSLFGEKREIVKKVLEVGIGDTPGGRSSLLMWREYFPNADIYGCDNNQEKLDACAEWKGIHAFFCDQGDAESLETLKEKIGTDFDLIIDDGSHEPAHQILTAKVLKDLLSPGGVYVIEDVNQAEPLLTELPDFQDRIFNGPGDRVLFYRNDT